MFLRFIVNENQNGIKLICILKRNTAMSCMRYILSSGFIRSNACSSSNIATQTQYVHIRTNMAHREAQFEGSRIRYDSVTIQYYRKRFIFFSSADFETNKTSQAIVLVNNPTMYPWLI